MNHTQGDVNLNQIGYFVCLANILKLLTSTYSVLQLVSVLLCFSVSRQRVFVLILCGWPRELGFRSNGAAGRAFGFDWIRLR